MHEAGLLAEAVAAALGRAPGRMPVALEVIVRDPLHVAPDAARLHAELALRAHGAEGVPVEVSSVTVVCAVCELPNHPLPASPFCAGCGWPLPRSAGAAVEAVARW